MKRLRLGAIEKPGKVTSSRCVRGFYGHSGRPKQDLQRKTGLKLANFKTPNQNFIFMKNVSYS